MPIKAQRRLEPTNIHRFGRGFDAHPIPDLTAIQTASYEAFQQADIDSDKRKEQGLDSPPEYVSSRKNLRTQEPRTIHTNKSVWYGRTIGRTTHHILASARRNEGRAEDRAK